MNKKATAELLKDQAIFLILAILFLVMMFTFINHEKNNAGVWEEYYAKEIVKTINSASAGDEIILDVHKATEIAQKNKLQSNSEIFTFDNKNKQACVKLGQGRKTCYNYFNNVNIEYDLKQISPPNILILKIQPST